MSSRAGTLLALRFLVPGRPVPKERARMGWTRRRFRRVWYTPEATREYARKAATYANQARGDWEYCHGLRWPHDARYALTLTIYTRGLRRPDTDNVLKNVKDALQGVLWDNDRHITEEHVNAVPHGVVPTLPPDDLGFEGPASH